MNYELYWRSIFQLMPSDDLVIARTGDGRTMIWRASMLKRNVTGPTPDHLSFPAKWWMPLDALPLTPDAGGPA